MKKLKARLIVTIIILATIFSLSINKVEAKTNTSTSNAQTSSKTKTASKKKKVKVTKVTIKKVSTLNLEQKTTLKATITPSNATNKKVTWKSSNSKVIKVVDTKKGIIQAKKVGKATITATATDGSGKKASITINVKCNHPEKYKEIKQYDSNYNLIQYKCKKCNKVLSTKKEKRFNVESYKGVWQYFENWSEEIPETELIINKIDDNKINFDLEMYRLASFKNVDANVVENYVEFNATNENGWKIKGKISLCQDVVILEIKQSSSNLIKTGITTFNIKSNTSILK